MGGPFALPVPAYRLGQNKSRLNKRKRTENAGGDDVVNEDAGAAAAAGGGSQGPAQFTSTPFGTQASSASSRPADSINPLSHSPDTLRQFAVAGLSPEEEVPSKVYPKFPHKSISSRNAFSLKRGGNRKKGGSRMSALTSGSEADVDTDASDSRGGNNDHHDTSKGGEEEEEDGFQMNYSARMQHLNTLTAIMHRCLHEGDIPRAKRAFNLLIRTKDVDIRVNGLWNIGVEILMREGEQPQQPQQQPASTNNTTTATDAAAADKGKQPEDPWQLGQPLVDDDVASHLEQDTQVTVAEEKAGEEGSSSSPLQLPNRWGSAANVDTVKEYLQALIQQYPYDQHRPHMVSAVDFWPALFSTEIYNLDAEFKKAMRQLKAKEETDEDDDDGNSSENEGSPPGYHHSDDDDAENGEEEEDRETRREDARQARRHHARDEVRHRARDEVRARTCAAAEQVAARMDQQMENRPYGTHGELLRLRGMLSLYVADLHLCASLVAKVEEHMRRRKEESNNNQQPSSGGQQQRKDLRSLCKHAETEEERASSRQRDAEIEKARRFFRKMLERGGDDVEDWVRKFTEGDEDEDAGH
ncbi:hypothetical protein PG994_000572 [Apiospora phragmitis]|uniref:Uncharacterized protein n=1 Tax=Apiospora phragmitis TaxID=2905665 RepID=A0ABR1X6W3_9PEZI